jgi:hypothetical protein
VSVSQPYAPKTWHGGFDPESIDSIVPVGKTVNFHVQLLNSWDQPIAKSDVPITVSQSLSGESAVAELNGGPAGERETAVTNSRGVADFQIVGVKTTSTAPLMLSANLPDYGGFGYRRLGGPTLLIRFKDQVSGRHHVEH